MIFILPFVAQRNSMTIETSKRMYETTLPRINITSLTEKLQAEVEATIESYKVRLYQEMDSPRKVLLTVMLIHEYPLILYRQERIQSILEQLTRAVMGCMSLQLDAQALGTATNIWDSHVEVILHRRSRLYQVEA